MTKELTERKVQRVETRIMSREEAVIARTEIAFQDMTEALAQASDQFEVVIEELNATFYFFKGDEGSDEEAD